jgi:hypothetical protein
MLRLLKWSDELRNATGQLLRWQWKTSKKLLLRTCKMDSLTTRLVSHISNQPRGRRRNRRYDNEVFKLGTSQEFIFSLQRRANEDLVRYEEAGLEYNSSHFDIWSSWYVLDINPFEPADGLCKDLLTHYTMVFWEDFWRIRTLTREWVSFIFNLLTSPIPSHSEFQCQRCFRCLHISSCLWSSWITSCSDHG